MTEELEKVKSALIEMERTARDLAEALERTERQLESERKRADKLSKALVQQGPGKRG